MHNTTVLGELYFLQQVADGLVLIAQQLTHHSGNKFSSSPHQSTQQLLGQQLPQQQQQQQQQQQENELVALIKACTSYCELATTVLSAPAEQQQQQHTKFRRQSQPQQQQPQQQLLPSQAATAVCGCLRQWADMHHGHVISSSNAEVEAMQGKLQTAAVVALGALLQQLLPVLAVHERAAVLTLLQSMAQPRHAAGSNLWSSSGSNNMDVAQQQQQQNNSLEVSQAAVQILGHLCRKAGSCGLTPDEHSSITRVLLEALTASCSSSSSSGGSSLSGGGGTSSRGNSSGGSSSGSNRLQEDAQHAKYDAALLVALQYAVADDKQGLQGYAAPITEAARKLFTYGTHQQPQQQHSLPVATDTSALASSAADAVPTLAHTPPPAAAEAASSSSSCTPTSSPSRYRPPHLRGETAAATTPAASAAQQQQQQQQEAFSDTESFSEWSDASDTEQGPSRRSSRDSSSSTKLRQQQQQQQQALLLQQDPIRSYRVRVALLQLLQALAQADAKLLHPYLAALLPSQQPLQPRPLSPHLLTVLLYDPCNKVRTAGKATSHA
jgi:uncharacterized membrane protein YgcG